MKIDVENKSIIIEEGDTVQDLYNIGSNFNISDYKITFIKDTYKGTLVTSKIIKNVIVGVDIV